MSWLKHVKQIAARPGDQPNPTLTLPKHVEDGLSALESSNRICEFFSSISQEFTPLDPGSLPDRLKDKLTNTPCSHPALPDHMTESPVFKKSTPTSVRMNPLVI